jgi:hypothetical protein
VPERRPTWGQLRRFCERQGFRPSATDHDFYDKVLADGSTAGTKISFGSTETEPVPPSLWPRIWRRLLRLRSESEFWRALDGGTVDYAIPPTSEPSQPLLEYLVRHLREDRHWPEDQIASTSRDEAQRLLNDWYSREKGPWGPG